MYPIGELRIIQVDGVINTTSLEIRPPVGREWLVVELAGMHDSSASNLYWNWYDSGSQIFNSSPVSMSSGQRYALSAIMGSTTSVAINKQYPIKISYTIYPKLTVVALDAGKKLSIQGLVLERPENFEMQLIEDLYVHLGWDLPSGIQALQGSMRNHRSAPGRGKK
jgi:hypothetical protein